MKNSIKTSEFFLRIGLMSKRAYIKLEKKRGAKVKKAFLLKLKNMPKTY